jgi:hypothetical protein
LEVFLITNELAARCHQDSRQDGGGTFLESKRELENTKLQIEKFT